MIILEVNRRRRSLYEVVLDSGGTVTVDVRTFDESPYRAGGHIDGEELEKLCCLSEYNRAHDRALYLLEGRDYARRELERRLCETAAPETAAQVTARLAEVGLLDDERFAGHMAGSLNRIKQYPRRRVEQELTRRGVDQEIARQAAEQTDIPDEELALAILQKKYYNKISDPAARQKTMAALARRGFSYGAIRKAMEAVSAEISLTEDEADCLPDGDI